MSSILLYSTNCLLKLLIQEKFRKDIHYVWCSELFDSSKVSPYTVKGLGAASSDPASLYKRIKEDVERNDNHSSKIQEQKLSFVKLAKQWESAGDITSSERDQINIWVKTAGFDMWRPIIYIIPRDIVNTRLTLVHPSKRAGLSDEYIIDDLKRDEFDIIEI